ncbi:MAG TPA: VOC family protein [Baekduia sp.]|nr:VOC family protein [Baekduia sp.]
MLNKTFLSNIFVLDQEEALDFYVGTLGLEKRQDVDLGFMRWLTVGAPGDDRELLLEVPASPPYDADSAAKLRELVSKGAAGGTFFQTDDAAGTYEALKAKNVEFTDELTEHFYGTDMGIRDPFGNSLRISQLKSPEEIAAGPAPGEFGGPE